MTDCEQSERLSVHKMLQQVDSRRISLGLSVRQLAFQLSVPPSLLSMALNRHRNPSKQFTGTLKKWLQAPAKGLSEHRPTELLRQFIADRSSHLAPSTVRFYIGKLEPFVLWCERQQISDVRVIQRADVSKFLSHVRKGRSHPALVAQWIEQWFPNLILQITETERTG